MAASVPDLPADPLVIRLAAGTSLVRVHHRDYGPIWFGPAAGAPPTSRFDAPAGEFGTLYVAESLTGAFVETVLRRANRIVARPFLDQRAWSILGLRRDCALAQLHGHGLVYHGVTNDICAGDLYAPSQALSLALWKKYPTDGIAYRARHNNDEICYAINDRIAPGDLEIVETRLFADHPKEIDTLLRQHGAVISPTRPLPDLGKAG